MNKLSIAKKKELLKVKECCKISTDEFEKNFEPLSHFEQKVICLHILDDDYDYEQLEELDEEKNADIIKFLSEKHGDIITELNNEMFSEDECVIDDEGNKYSFYGSALSLSDFSEDEESEFNTSDMLLDKMKEMKTKSKNNK